MEQFDEIIDCPKSGGEICYRVQITNEVSNYMSLSCGFISNSLMKEGEEYYEQSMESMPELYKDLAWTDPKTGMIWIPNTINVEDVGMVFPYGTSGKEWSWAAVKAVKIPKKEQKNHPIPGEEGKFQTYKMDMNTMQNFSERNYVNALDYIGILGK
jgi:hypothetical protein|tara:strand:- start:1750 stop:2217 length:468 start_codon:yes stop_codon:yes gene_type:complete